jgi:hypothetical protein
MTKPTDAELLMWAMRLVRSAQEREAHGCVRVELKAGRIVSARVEETMLPGK